MILVINGSPVYASTLTIDQSDLSHIAVDDGIRMICFGQGPASTGKSFWQPVNAKHDSVGGNPTDCTTGGDDLVSAAHNTYDTIFGATAAIDDSDANNEVVVVETSPSRVVVQSYKNDTRDHYGYSTVYPNGYIFSQYNLGSLTANDNATLGQHYNSTTPEVFNRDATNRAYTIADTSNNNYAGLSIIPFKLLTLPNLDTTYQSSGDDFNGWTGSNTSPMGDVRNDTGWLMHFDYSTYRATTTTTSTRRTNYQTPDYINTTSNGSIWDDAGEQSLFWTSFEAGSSDLCSGGDGWDTGFCSADDNSYGDSGGPNAFIGNYGAQFDGGTTGTDLVYAEESLTAAPKYSIRFAFKVSNETLANTQQVTIVQFRDSSNPIGSLQLFQDGSGNLKLCTTTTTQTCSSSSLGTANWYQVEYSVLVNDSSNYGSRAEIWINGISEAIDTSSTGTNHINTVRLGLVNSDTAENIVSFDNVAINKTEIGMVSYNPNEGIYTVESSWNQRDLSFDIDRSGYTANGAAFKIRNWRSSDEPVRLYLEGTEKTDGTHYNMDILPFAEAWVYDSDGSCGTAGWDQLASAGDTSLAAEYIYDATSDFDFSSTHSCRWGDTTTDALYFGRKDRMSGLNTHLDTKGVGNPTVTWEYCSSNSDISTACDTWASLGITETNEGASTFENSGNFYFTPPSQWIRSTENSGIKALFYIRARVTAGSYTTYPIEDTIKPDIILFQSLETISSDGQTFTLDTNDPSMTFSVTGIGANTVNNGITTSVASTYDELPFGNLSISSPKYLAHQLSIEANTPNGFIVYMKMTNFLQGEYPANNIDPFAAVGATWTTPVVWSSPTGTTPNENTGWIGANTSDTNVPGWSSGSGKFGPVSQTNQIVMYSDKEIIDGTTAVVSYAVETNMYQPEDKYAGTIQYTALPLY